MRVLYLRHQLCDDMKPLVKDDPQQTHQVFMLELPGKSKSAMKVRSSHITPHSNRYDHVLYVLIFILHTLTSSLWSPAGRPER